MQKSSFYFLEKFAHSKHAFTLAEVLITIAVIGVVATLTVPQLVQNYKKHVVATKLTKFATMYQNAIRLSEVENGSRDAWERDYVGEDASKEGEFYLETYNKYLRKYIKTTSEKVFEDGVAFALADGSGFFYYYDLQFCVDYKKCLDVIQKAEEAGEYAARNAMFVDGKNIFLFGRDGLPYTWEWQGTVEDLYVGTYGCGTTLPLYCTKLIEMNGWKIPDDYPIKF